MKKFLLSALAVLCLVTALTACSRTGADKADTDSPTEKTEDAVPTEQTISGIVNRTGDFLTLLGDDDAYHIFDFGVDVDPSALEEGDRITVTYNGTLDSEDSTPVATDIEKEA